MNDRDGTFARQRPVNQRRAALIVIDVQNWIYSDQAYSANTYLRHRLDHVVLPNIRQLIRAGRETGAEVMYTVIENLTRDGRDRCLDYKISGIFVAKGSWEARVVDAISPGEDDIVLSKTSSSLFNSTNFDYLLRNLGVEHLIVTGLLTDQCVDHTIRDAADHGYRPICVSDACGTFSDERHASALALFAGYCRVMTTDELIGELRAAVDADGQ